MGRRAWPAAACTLWLFACGADEERVEPAGSAPPRAERLAVPGVLVEPAWLARHLDHPELIVVDARPEAEYAVGHVAGAVSLPPTELLDPRPERARDLAPMGTVTSRLGAAGIDDEHAVVVYGSADHRDAARLFWILEVHGHRAVAVLSGGYALWTAGGGDTSVARPAPAPREFVPRLDPERLATRLRVLRSLRDPDVTILDARTAEEYAGAASAARRSGHIPGAVHVDFRSSLAELDGGACEVKSLPALGAAYASLDPSDKVIAYCNSGNRASVSYLALRALGRDAAVYDGSWLEWGNDAHLPIETGLPIERVAGVEEASR